MAEEEKKHEMQEIANEFQFSDEEQQIYRTFMATVEKYKEKHNLVMANIADDVVKYILRQFSKTARDGYLYQVQYEEVLDSATWGLTEIIYFSEYETHLNYDFAERDALQHSSYNLIVMLLSQVFMGRNYALRVKELERVQQVVKNY